ncbi:MAG: sigma-70 family RNA polymerase sigma factor [Clostridiales bacterium]|nr:sigma-70 family RNA polymerase sigma factor [Clostridiales bacterium]
MTKEEKIEINYLVKQVANNNSEAMGILYQKMYKVVFSFLFRYSYNVDYISEAVDKTFDTIIQKSNRIVYVNCYSWILTIGKNQLRNVMKRESKRKSFLTKQDSYVTEEDICEKLDIQKRLDMLSAEEKHILYLLHLKNCDYKEVSKILHMSDSTIRRREKEIIKTLGVEDERI